MVANSGNEPRLVPDDESVDDARPKIPPRVMFALMFGVFVVGSGIALCFLYVPGLYSFPRVAITMVVTVVLLAILIVGVDNSNTASLQDDSVRLTERKGAEVGLSRYYHNANYDQLKILGSSEEGSDI